MKIHNLKRRIYRYEYGDDWFKKGSYRSVYLHRWRRTNRMHTTNERRASQIDDDADVREELRSSDRLVRLARNATSLPTKWDDGRVSLEGGKSWKDYTRCRKQWAVNL